MKKKKIKIQVLGSTNSLKEKNFYLSIFDKEIERFISRYENRKTYEIVDQAKVILSIDSTLGYESAARGNKVGFFVIRKKSFPYSTVQFGWPIKKKYKGPFWSDSNSFSEIARVLNFLKNKKNSKIQKVIKKNFENIMTYDEGNKKFISLKKELKL